MNRPLEIGLWLLGSGLMMTVALGNALARARTARRLRQRQPLLVSSAVVPQGCAIPYRIQGGQFQVCLISLSNQSGWGFPKGMVDPPETVAQAALRESFEEAGIRGLIVGEALGQYSYVKRNVTLAVTVFLMRVTKTEKRWPERRVRQRKFYPVSQARALLATVEQRQLFDLALARLASLSILPGG